jgi:release factor glutamine methyltransferase
MTTPPGTHNVRNLLREATTRLDDRLEASLLLMHVLERNHAWLFAHADDEVSAEQATAFNELVARRTNGEPVAYLVGRRDFWSLELEVTPATLIPRPETELLVELALARIPTDWPCAIADLGTGSGAIALAIASERPLAAVTATDASEDALQVAQRNAGRLGLDRVRFVQGSWMAPLMGQTFDLIVSNPPYIESGDAHLGQGDLRYEPSTALSSGSDGLDDIRRIVAQAIGHLSAGGWLLMEHGWNQGDVVRCLLEAAGYDEVFTSKDLEHRDRVSGGRRP